MQPKRARRGAALVEFALVSLIFYLLLAATIEFGRAVFAVQVIQDSSRVAARELAIYPLPIEYSFEDALQDPYIRSNVWDATRLVVPATGTDAAIAARFAELPLVNRALRPLFIYDDTSCPGNPVFRYPGRAVLANPVDPCSFTGNVRIPIVEDGLCCAELDVLTELRADAATGPFSGVTTSTSPNGIVAVVINYPFQAAALTAYRNLGPAVPNAGEPVDADPDSPIGTYSGARGLGAQFALGRKVQPYRRILTAQSIFRREVME